MGNLNLVSEQHDGQSAFRLDLGASQTMQSASDLHGALAEAADRALPLIVDASSIERLATVSVQLLLATQRTLATRGIAMEIRRPSDAFLKTFRDLGIEPSAQGWILDESGHG